MTQFKYGRRAPKGAPAIQFAAVRGAAAPDIPAAADYLGKLSGWEMLGNDRYGDCVAVTWSNVRRLVTAELTTTEAYPGINEVIKLYETQNPGFPQEDNGMDIQTCLEHLVKVGGPDGVKAVAFAKVDHTNAEEVKAAIATFGYVWVGINVLDINMTQFDSDKPWGYSANSAVDGGHSVIVGGYGTGTGRLGGDERFITWAEETSFTDQFWSHQVEEAWVVVFPEHLGSESFLAGVDVEALAAEYKALTGKDLPVPAPPAPTPTPPAPTPTPTPTPEPTDPVIAFFEAMEAWIEGFLNGQGHPNARDQALMDAYAAHKAAAE